MRVTTPSLNIMENYFFKIKLLKYVFFYICNISFFRLLLIIITILFVGFCVAVIEIKFWDEVPFLPLLSSLKCQSYSI